ncbi:LamB/YcsF family protein [bacterium]|nr:MAG: LamB/YcsF family protein [bacterium]
MPNAQRPLFIDLNADIGEGFPWDDELMAIVTSGNVGLGDHAGSPELTVETAERWFAAGKAIGLHPGYPDRDNMGRRSPVSFTEGKTWGADLFAQVHRATVGRLIWRYLKPHGAFYNNSGWNALPSAIFSLQHLSHFARLPLLGLADTPHEALARREGLAFFREGFADRRYTEEGQLVSRSEPSAVIESDTEAAEQAVRLALSGRFDSLCLHGDKPDCVVRARAVRSALEREGFALAPFAP